MTLPCPRRDQAISPLLAFLPKDDHYREDHTCSYCGSFHPDMFMERLEAGDIELGPTDKSYKVYLKNDGGQPLPIKFYFQHLSVPQMERFIALLKDNKLKFGYPGYFYRMPFFIQVGPGDNE